MADWHPALPSHFETKTLPAATYIFHHEIHGTFVITRAAKIAESKEINFTLQLSPPGNVVPLTATCHLFVVNGDPDALLPAQIGEHRGPNLVLDLAPRNPSSIGYGDINIDPMEGLRLIYLIHYVFAVTGVELGVALFVVVNIVNPFLEAACVQCGMRPGRLGGTYQGACWIVKDRSWNKASGNGWQR